MVKGKAVLILICCTVFVFFTAAYSSGEESGIKTAGRHTPETYVPQDDTAATTGGEVLDAGAEPSPAGQDPEKRRIVDGWLTLLGSGGLAGDGDENILGHVTSVPADLVKSFGSIGSENDGAGFFGVLGRTILALGIGFLVVLGLRKVYGEKLETLENFTSPEHESTSRLLISLFRNAPSLATIVLFVISSISVFLIFAGSVGPKGRMLFQAILGTFLIFAACSVISRILFLPDNSEYRPLRISESLVQPLYRACYLSAAAILAAMLWVKLIVGLGTHVQTVGWVVVVAGTLIIAFYGGLVLHLKRPMAESLLAKVDREGGGWLRGQVASKWHILALTYLLAVWLIWFSQSISGTARQSGEFIVSMLIVPIYFGLLQAGRHVIRSVVDSLGLGRMDDSDEDKDEETRQREAEERRQEIISKSESIFNLILIGTLATWLLSLWGYNIPFAGNAVRALFESLVVLALALLCWRATSTYIEKKIEEAVPEEEEKTQDEDDEFGGAVARGRAYTLLPMLRKVIGSVLVVMVVLIIISSLGVNIGPLLAGAGVVGLAVGFGAQKLVSDVLSGFFFLLDDAFRVGEYIQAGSVSGSVEAITLRNVMLRHHKGMLQIVPHSDLGAITNFMRGGIVVKFPLEFPYDTDIDKVRKVIKKVGIAMLDDPELGDDFLRPVKSQGVHEITNSVMVIRVKFTAKPGKQFVIRREAFRRITEALNAKGIYYAHKKVIVDFPEGQSPDSLDESTRQKVLEAGAAAAMATEEEGKPQA